MGGAWAAQCGVVRVVVEEVANELLWISCFVLCDFVDGNKTIFVCRTFTEYKV